MLDSLLRLLFGLLLLTACGDDDAGTGTIHVRVYGESFIEDGIPAEEMHDGWAVTFDRFDLSLHDIVVAGVTLEDPGPRDLAAASGGDGHEVGSVTAAARDHDEPSFTIARVEVEGSAEKDGTVKSFHWLFTEPTRYERCETTTSVEQNREATFQITIHADHFFYDSLVSEEPQLLFGALADADVDADGSITETELRAAGDIGAYDPGNEEIEDLWSWLVAQHRTLGHVDGEGHCEAAD
jgi:hypothetical protein